MKIKTAGILGYCPGVRRAMDTAFACLSQRDRAVFSHGELIHNAPALELLASKGLRLWRGETEGWLIVRAHGLPPRELAALEKTGLSLRDATCPRVRKVQSLVAREAARGRLVIIWGKAAHPEVVGLTGHAGDRARVVAGPEEVAGLPEADEVLLVAQTTQDLERWPRMVEAVQARWPEALIRNTICEATELRQQALAGLAEEVEALVIVGGRNSGNTARLADLGRRAGRPVFLVESADELDPADFSGFDSVGVAAGASTSNWQIAQTLSALRAMARSRRDFGAFLPRLLRVSVLSGLLAALGLASLAMSAGLLGGFRPPAVLFSFFFFQAAALHLFRHFLRARDRSQGQALRFNDPDRAAFFAKYRRPLAAFGLCAALMALAAAQLGGPRLLALEPAIWLGALIHIFAPRPGFRPTLVRTLLGPFLLAGGWALAISAAYPPEPGLAARPADLLSLSRLFTAGAVFSQIFTLKLMGEILAVRGDLIFGRPTLLAVFGEKSSRRLMEVWLLVWALALAAGRALGALPPLALGLILSGPLYNHFLLKPLFRAAEGRDSARADQNRNPALSGYIFEAALYGQLPASGLAALLWSLW
ncbi:MAG: 4-hydroxy-3-methylbut-2-enyl diphosphate reductase [Candidatus Adiutrix sp.]|nr:4-hydroxy-3-methylbut-2-enyl diphosphate reductase [Candidatus Adiutrix sp.]